MIYQKKKMVKTIMNTDPTAFDRDFNCFIQNVIDRGYEYDVHLNDGMNGMLCAQIFYTSVTEIPESIVEDHWLCDDQEHCYDCPVFVKMKVLDPRGNKKWFRCEICAGRVSAESTACEWYYEQKGERFEGKNT